MISKSMVCIFCYTQGHAKREGVRVGGVTPLHPNFLKFVGILTKCVVEISWPNVVSKFEVFYHQIQNAEFYQFIQSRRRQTFTNDDRF